MSYPHKIRFGRVMGGVAVIAALLLAFSVHAVEVTGLYDVDIPVSSQSRELREIAFKQALEQVMVRVSGNTMIVGTPGVETLMALASRYVRKFQYRALTEDDKFLIAERAAGEANAPKPTRILAIQFDGKAIETQLRTLNITTWGANRPAVLVWVGVEQLRDRQIISEAEHTPVRVLLEQAAQRRGIPLIFPLMDLEDQTNIKFGDIRGNYAPSIRAASNRYGADLVLTGFVSRNSAEQWSANWTVYRDNVSSGWSENDRLAIVISSAINGVTDILVSRYAETSSQRETRYELLLQVDHVNNVEDYARSMKYLSSLSAVESVQPYYIVADVIQYKVLIRGEPRHLQRAISLERTLVPLDVSQLVSGQPFDEGRTPIHADLYYRLY